MKHYIIVLVLSLSSLSVAETSSRVTKEWFGNKKLTMQEAIERGFKFNKYSDSEKEFASFTFPRMFENNEIRGIYVSFLAKDKKLARIYTSGMPEKLERFTKADKNNVKVFYTEFNSSVVDSFLLDFSSGLTLYEISINVQEI